MHGPNSQNIPIRTPKDPAIRQAFIPHGTLPIDVDYTSCVSRKEKELRKFYYDLIVRMEILLRNRPRLVKAVRKAQRRGRASQIAAKTQALVSNLQYHERLRAAFDEGL
jgi:hypothetical protein